MQKSGNVWCLLMAKNQMTERIRWACDVMNVNAGSGSVKICVSLQVEIHHDGGVYVCFLMTENLLLMSMLQ